MGMGHSAMARTFSGSVFTCPVTMMYPNKLVELTRNSQRFLENELYVEAEKCKTCWMWS